MPKYDYDFVVIGGGAAGLTAASGAAQLGARTIIIEREKELGGDCLHFGCVPSKTLIKSANVYYQMAQSARYGLPEINLPPVEYKLISARINKVIEGIQQHDSVERFNALGAEVAFASPEFRDEHTLLVDGKEISARKFLLATGSRAAIPEIEGLKRAGFITNREIFGLSKLPESLLVLGAGPIAIEMAQAFNRLGAKVNVIQRSSQILSKEDKDMADMVMTSLQQEGVRFHLDCKVIRVERNNTVKKIIVEQGGKQKSIDGDEILVALGRKVNSENLGLDKIGVKLGKRGIDVDSRMRTNHKHILAAGDVTGGYQFTHAAGYEGGIVVSNAIFNIPRKADYTWMPWCTFTSPELASVGMNEKAAKAAGIKYSVFTENFQNNDRALAEEEGKGKLKLLTNSNGKPLGVQILGHHGGEILAEWVAVFNGKVKMSTLAGAIHPYPTLTEINKKVAGSLFADKIFSNTTKKILKFLFKYQGSNI